MQNTFYIEFNKLKKSTYEGFVSVCLSSPVVRPTEHDSIVFETTKSCSLNSTHSNPKHHHKLSLSENALPT